MLSTQHPPARSELKIRRTPQERFYHDHRQAMFKDSKKRMEERFG